MAARILSIIGALFYILWAALHFQAAAGVVKLGDTVPPSMIQGRLFQDAWTLYSAAAVIAVVSVITIFRRWRLGYWLNLGVAGITDVGFIVLILVPGYAPLWPGVQGPVAWIIGLAFSTAAMVLTRRASTRPEPASVDR
ncbi:hypothetical protein [Kutzneria kofuensis]|uniref:Uncharacterized protein n=1 Tax=Kutzneria kofuensis TaxID=103725 RepID=A0A7W9KQ18_9PSEU|nr:hypothetical protein [Kutzneria kofuensis]MBB5896638.1 hypothetical protein [Kutzneria kofuensis]